MYMVVWNGNFMKAFECTAGYKQIRTHHCEDGRGGWRSQQAVGGNTSVVPGVLRDETGDK